jgi:hypothetical protein
MSLKKDIFLKDNLLVFSPFVKLLSNPIDIKVSAFNIRNLAG